MFLLRDVKGSRTGEHTMVVLVTEGERRVAAGDVAARLRPLGAWSGQQPGRQPAAETALPRTAAAARHAAAQQAQQHRSGHRRQDDADQESLIPGRPRASTRAAGSQVGIRHFIGEYST